MLLITIVIETITSIHHKPSDVGQDLKGIRFRQVGHSRLKPPHLPKYYRPVKGIQPIKCPKKGVKPLNLLAVKFRRRKKQ
jgi:hypothetical protein